jgi:hypothetical protein
MTTPASSLQQAVNQYRLHVSGVDFWTPYWINLEVGPYYLNAPLRGKGSPIELAGELKHIIASGADSPKTPEGMRQLMREHGLGVDCSGFVYHVLAAWLARFHIRLSQHLLVDRDDIVEAISHHPERAGLLPDPMPPVVSLDEVCRAWSKNPAHITNVARLVHTGAVIGVPRAGSMRPGDMIKTTTGFGDHLGIVTSVTPHVVTYYSSDDRPGELGGVSRHTITVTNPKLGLEDQMWDQASNYHPGSNRDGVWRLNVLAALV